MEQEQKVTPLEHGKPMEEIKVPELTYPSREEYRHLLKTGKDAEGNEAHPEDLKNLRNARMADLLAFGQEVNKATGNLKNYIDRITGSQQFTLLSVIAFLINKGVLPPEAGQEFDEFAKQADQELAVMGAEARKIMAEKAKKVEEPPVEVVSTDTKVDTDLKSANPGVVSAN